MKLTDNRFALVALAALGALTAEAAFPKIGDVSVCQAADRSLVVTYKLTGAPAIVTLDLLTNAVGRGALSIGGENMRELVGDVGHAVGLDHDFGKGAYSGSIRWIPYRAPIADEGLDFNAGTFTANVSAYPTNIPPDIVVVDLDLAGAYGYATQRSATAKRFSGLSFYPDVSYLPGGLGHIDYRRGKLVMKKVHAAGVEWVMGSSGYAVPKDGRLNEIPHLVLLTKDYYLGVFEATRGHAQKYYAHKDSNLVNTDFKSKGYATIEDEASAPVNSRSYDGVRGPSSDTDISGDPTPTSFIGRLRGLTGLPFDLPSNAEWEFAAWAGTTNPFGVDNADYTVEVFTNRIGWSKQNITNYIDGTAYTCARPVALKEPNEWGFYDMMGNVHEIPRDLALTEDAYFASFGGKGYNEPVVDPLVLTSTGAVANRFRLGGGSAEDFSGNWFRVGRRPTVKKTDPWMGFRVRLPAAF